ncbi:Ku protein [Cellulomonas cellasea]|uniref:Non-homologous end joining protein Ku n=2 Tax=Cellulomonas cellasea TaxID=43670 RepID=A0A0A0B9M8_9CELL|nr:Ku protein [Cellulomonas cellasea]KGM02504.1 DNA repair protein [Cellulomonas cellasea DSM 20118]GEA88721.1 non-homologous end joining protein Ku [Cellulomonas cellasea]
MRAIWKGAVAFGLVNVPVKLYAATGEHEVPLHQVHRDDGGRIRYRKVCSVCGETIQFSDIAKGYETDEGELVVLTDQDLAELPLATEREISVVEFVPAEQVDPILLAKTYYLEPEKTSAKPYALLREALEASDRMAVVKVALRQRESMAVLRVRDNVICLQTLLWPDEVREADFPILDTDVTVRPQELAMASSLVESLAGDFDPSGFEDSYQAALEALIEAKVSSGSTRQVPATAAKDESTGGEVVDLLAALQRSVEKARAGRGGAAADTEEATEETSPAKRARASSSDEDGDPGAGRKPAAKRASKASASAKDDAPAASTRSRRAKADDDGEPAAPKKRASTARSGAAKEPAKAASRRRAS